MAMTGPKYLLRFSTWIMFGPDGSLYLALQSLGEIVQISPVDGSILRVVASGLSCPTAMAVDPTGAHRIARVVFQQPKVVVTIERAARRRRNHDGDGFLAPFAGRLSS